MSGRREDNRITRRSFVAGCAASLALAPLLSGCSRRRESDWHLTESTENATFVALEEGYEAADENTRKLQEAIDAASPEGGEVRLGPGVFYFSQKHKTTMGNYVISMKDNVAVLGSGMGATVLKPLGVYATTGEAPHGIDMFYYDGLLTGTYLEHASFSDFTIDGSSTQGDPDGYNASGKGFFFKLFRSCTWDRVEVSNTDGTGFGADFPIDCAMRNCVAWKCGKNATADSAGASGFGVGTGYSDDESMVVENCVSHDNAKFGFFFEHQTIFNTPHMEATTARGFQVLNCGASGNLVNFGGNRANDVRYVDCVSGTARVASQEEYTAFAFRFMNHSTRITVEDAVIDQSYRDVDEGDAFAEPIAWALRRNIAEVGKANEGLFRPKDIVLRGEAAMFLWRYAGRPGEVLFGPDPQLSDPMPDVPAQAYYADAVRWLVADGITRTDLFRAQEPLKRLELVNLLWRFARLLAESGSEAAGAAGSAGGMAHSTNDAAGATAPREGETDAAAALRWAREIQIVARTEEASALEVPCTRAEAIGMFYAFDLARRMNSR